MSEVTSNKDMLVAIFEKVNVMSAEISALRTDVDEVKEHVKYTNGKVAGLLEKDIRREEREKLQDKLASAPQQITDSVVVNKPATDWDKVRGMITAIITIVSIALGSGAIIVQTIAHPEADKEIKEVTK